MAFSRIFPLLLKTNADTAEKVIKKKVIKKYKDCHRNDNKNMAKTKATVRRLPVKTHHLPGWLVNREYGIRKKSIYPFKITETLPEQKMVIFTKKTGK